MLKQFIIFLPCTVCLVWAVITATSQDRSKSKRYLLILAILGFFFFYFQAMFAGFPIPPENYPTVNILRKVVSLLLFPAGILYILSLTEKESNNSIVCVLIFPAIFLTGALSIIYRLMGPEVRTEFCRHILAGEKPPVGYTDRIFQIYEIFSHELYKGFIYLMFAISFILLIRFLIRSHYRFGDLRAFLFHGKESLLVNAIVGCAFMLTGSFLLCNIFEPLLEKDSVLTIIIFLIISMLLFFFFYMGAVFDEMTVFWSEIFAPKLTWERRYLESHPEIAEIKRALDRGSQKSSKGFSVFNRFLIYVEEQEPYLNPDTTIEEASEAILIDKDRLAKVIKETTGLNYRAYMNTKRVEEAKKLMRAFPDLPMNLIAEKSGFTSNSTFSRKFSEIEGMSPTEWIKLSSENTENQ